MRGRQYRSGRTLQRVAGLITLRGLARRGHQENIMAVRPTATALGALLTALVTPLALTTGWAAEDAKNTWDVSSPPGERREIPIDVRSGTWMSVDVSPDGGRVLFDLLGDIYELPF